MNIWINNNFKIVYFNLNNNIHINLYNNLIIIIKWFLNRILLNKFIKNKIFLNYLI